MARGQLLAVQVSAHEPSPSLCTRHSSRMLLTPQDAGQ